MYGMACSMGYMCMCGFRMCMVCHASQSEQFSSPGQLL